MNRKPLYLGIVLGGMLWIAILVAILYLPAQFH